MIHARIRTFTQDLLDIAETVVDMLSRALTDPGYQTSEHISTFKRIEREITLKEIGLEERCLTFLAMEHPAAIDLRTMVSIMKTKDDLKRINDLTLHIIERLADLRSELFESFEFGKTGMLTIRMIERSMHAFISKELDYTSEVYTLDDQIHIRLHKVFRIATTLMKSTRIDSDQLLSALSISRHLGLITDHTSNIARTTHYLVTGEIIPRHPSFDNQLTASLDISTN